VSITRRWIFSDEAHRFYRLFVWRTLYLGKMIGFSTKIRIMIDWTLDLFIERSIAQLQDVEHGNGKSEDKNLGRY